MSTTWAGALKAATDRLDAAGIEGCERDARRLLAHVLALPVSHLTFHLREATTPALLEAFNSEVERRAEHRPISHITGRRLFFDLEFHISDQVLDPRPETEILVAAALDASLERVLDLGTGSGNILLSLLAAAPGATGIGVDQSASALKVARANATAFGLNKRVELFQSDWFAAVNGRFDLIVSNPPYISAREYSDLAEDVRLYEPKEALTPGGDGLDAYRRIAKDVSAYLTPQGRLMLEIGPTQAAAVSGIFTEQGLIYLDCLADLDGRDRVMIFKNGTI